MKLKNFFVEQLIFRVIDTKEKELEIFFTHKKVAFSQFQILRNFLLKNLKP
jgi:hypothetical protein